MKVGIIGHGGIGCNINLNTKNTKIELINTEQVESVDLSNKKDVRFEIKPLRFNSMSGRESRRLRRKQERLNNK